VDIEYLREYCLRKNGVTESFPFGDSTLVFKVKEKIFLLVSIVSSPLQFNVKCDPEKAEELRDRYPDIRPGYHMNKKHWNTVLITGSIPERLLKEMIDESYTLVIRSLPAKERARLEK
jgi:predicted DNA-binding protein (MmcQ/YjbR family)